MGQPTSRSEIAAKPTSERSIYRPSGRVSFAPFATLSLLAVAGALGSAFLLDWAFVHNFYYIILMPALAALLVLPLVMMAVSFGRCRNRLIALLLALVVSGLLYVGSYAFGLIREFGWQNADRLDLLPAYIRFRMATDISEDHPGLKRDTTPSTGMNWLKFALEQSVIVMMLVPAAFRRADRAYCESCGKWKYRALAFFPAGSGASLANLVAQNRIDELASQQPIVVGTHDRRYAGMAIEYCRPNDGEELSCNAVLCVREVKYGGGMAAGPKFDWSLSRTAAPRYELNYDELAPLRRILPELAAIAPEPIVMESEPEASATPLLPSQLAQVLPVPSRDAGQVLTKSAIWLGNGITLADLGFFFGGIGLTLWSLSRLASSDQREKWILLAALGVGTAVCTGFIGLRNPGAIANRMLLGRTRSALSRRLDRWFKVEDPDAVFVEVVPRAHWGKAMLETATDIGLLKVDRSKKVVLFEGDRERWNFPASAILRVEAEPATAAAGTIGEVKYYMTVIVARTADGFREFPFAVRATKILVATNHRENSARQLADEIAALKA